MIRSFIFNTNHGSLSVTESTKPNSVIISIRGDAKSPSSITITRKQFEELARLASYSAYSDSINWVDEPKQSELDFQEIEK